MSQQPTVAPLLTTQPKPAKAESSLLSQHSLEVLNPVRPEKVLGTGGLKLALEKLPEESVRVVHRLTDAQLIDELGLPHDIRPMALQQFRADPISNIRQYSPSAQARFSSLGMKFASLGGYLPGQEGYVQPGWLSPLGERATTTRDVDPKLVELMRKLATATPDGMYKPTQTLFDHIQSFGGLFPSNVTNKDEKPSTLAREALWRMAFGDTAVPDPTENRAPGETLQSKLSSVLTSEQDLKAYLGHWGVVGLVGNIWLTMFAKQGAAAASFAALSVAALWGHDTEFTRIYNEGLNEGQNYGQAILNAYEGSHYPRGVKGSMEAVLGGAVPASGLRAIAGAIPMIRFPGGALEPAVVAPGGILESAMRVGKGAITAFQESWLHKPYAETPLGKESMPDVTIVPVKLTRKRTVDELMKLGGYKESDVEARWEYAKKEMANLSSDHPELIENVLQSLQDDVRALKTDAITLAADKYGYKVAIGFRDISRHRGPLRVSDDLPLLTKAEDALVAIDNQGWTATHVFRPAAEFGQNGLESWDNSSYLGVPKYMASIARLGARALGNTVQVFDPRAVSTSDVNKIFLAHRYIIDEGTSKWGLLGSVEWEPLLKYLRYDPKTGRFLAASRGDNHSVVMMNKSLEQLRKEYDFDSPAVMEFFIRWKKSTEAIKQHGLAEGVLTPEQLVKDYSPLFVIDDPSAVQGLQRATRPLPKTDALGVEQTFEHERKFATPADGIKANGELFYESDPLVIWKRHVNEVVTSIADKRLGAQMEHIGALVRKGDLLSQRSTLRFTKKMLNSVIHASRQGLLTDEAVAGLRKSEPRAKAALASQDVTAALEDLRTQVDKDISDLSALVAGDVRLTVGGPTLTDLSLPNEAVAKEILANLDLAQSQGFIKGVRDWGDALRQANSTLDFSASFLQGLPTLFTRPDAWSKAMGKQFEAFFDSTARARYLNEHLEVLRDFLGHEGIMGTSEFTAAGAAGLGKSVRVGQVPVGKIAHATIAPFNRAFDTLGDVARLESYGALRSLARTPEELTDIANYVNHATGVFSTARLGVTPRARAIEGLMLFSPRYNRAGLALIADIFKGGQRAELAQKSLTLFAVWGLLGYYGVSQLLGQKAKLDPRPISAGGDGPDFLTWDIAGQKFGIGSWWLTATRLVGSIMGHSANNPDGFLTLSSLDKVSQDMLRTLRGRLAPLVSSGIDIVLGSTYLGEHVDRSDEVNWLVDRARFTALYESPRFAPLAFQPFMQSLIEGDPKFSFSGIAAEEAGLRVFDVPMLEQGAKLAEVAVQNMTHDQEATVEDQLAGNNKAPIELQGYLGWKKATDADPGYRAWNNRHRQDTFTRGSENDMVFLDFSDASDKINLKYDAEINQAWAAFRTPGPDFAGGRATLDVVDAATKNRYGALNELRAEPRFATLFEKLGKKNDLKLLQGKIFVGDLAYLEYAKRLNAKDATGVAGGDYENPNGSFNFAARDKLLAELATKYGSLDSRFDSRDIASYIKARADYRGARPAFDPIYVDWMAARDGPLTSYWDMDKTLWGKRKDFAAIHEMLTTTDTMRANQLALRYPGFRAEWNDAKVRWRMAHPEMDAELGFIMGGSPVTMAAARLLYKKRQGLLGA